MGFRELRQMLAKKHGRPMLRPDSRCIELALRGHQARCRELAAVAAAASPTSTIGSPQGYASHEGEGTSDGQRTGDVGASSKASVLLLTAYDQNYAPGPLCEAANRAYGKEHGYDIECDVHSTSDMLEAVRPRTHCTWYKVLMIRRALSRLRSHSGAVGGEDAEGDTVEARCREGRGRKTYDWLAWIDADAAVVDRGRSLDFVLRRALAAGQELLLGEDLSRACFANCGVMLIRVSLWNALLWEEVWDGPLARRYFDAPYHEQSALLKVLRERGEMRDFHEQVVAARHGGADSEDRSHLPFHSFLGGPPGGHWGRKVAILPHHLLNTNRGLPRRRGQAWYKDKGPTIDFSGPRPPPLPTDAPTVVTMSMSGSDGAAMNLDATAVQNVSHHETVKPFIFHAVGHGRPASKLRAISAALQLSSAMPQGFNPDGVRISSLTEEDGDIRHKPCAYGSSEVAMAAPAS